MKKLFLLAALALGGVLSAYAYQVEITCPDGSRKTVNIPSLESFKSYADLQDYLRGQTKKICECPDCKVNIDQQIAKDYFEVYRP